MSVLFNMPVATISTTAIDSVVRQSAKSRSAPDVLTCNEIRPTAGGARTAGANHGLLDVENKDLGKVNCLRSSGGRRLQE